jgi:hypothetical protein
VMHWEGASIQGSASQETDQVHIDSNRLSKGASVTILDLGRTNARDVYPIGICVASFRPCTGAF